MSAHRSITVQVQELETTLVLMDASPNAPSHPVPILFLHGWGVSSELMLPIAERMATLGYRCIVPDLPGFGASQPPLVGWSVQDYADWTNALLDGLAIPRVNLFAHSFGGRISLLLGSCCAERIDKIALTGAAGVPPRRSFSASARLTLYKSLREGLNRIGAAHLACRLAAWYSRRYGSADYLSASGVLRDTFLKVVNEDLRPFAAQISRPTLLFWGEQDQDTPLWQGQALERLIPDSGLIVYPGADHYGYLRHQVEITRTLDHFYRH